MLGVAAQNNSNSLAHQSSIQSKAANAQLVSTIQQEALVSNVLYGVAGTSAGASVGLFFIEGRF